MTKKITELRSIKTNKDCYEQEKYDITELYARMFARKFRTESG